MPVGTADMSTRVSEYVPEVIAYIQTLVDKGIAYESNGSVYFSVTAFEQQGHKYGKLMPEQVGNSDLLAEGEGALTADNEKKAASDFVLWKRTKVHQKASPVDTAVAGATTAASAEAAPAAAAPTSEVKEPSWDSPWGPGRPGWHIECSVMSGFALRKFGGGTLDVHAGGVDLKFPHHENEIAQSEAYQGSHQWVNYWLHTGHVNIKGLKMSKSLKNFITIRAALECYTSRQIRFCFLLHKYNAPMDYSDATMTQAVNIEKIFAEYFHNVKALLRRLGDVSSTSQYVGPAEEAMFEQLEATKSQVRSALLDDFDTPSAVSFLAELVKECNKYMEKGTGSAGGSSGESTTAAVVNPISSVVLTSVAKFVTSILRTFGLVPSGADVGFPLMDSSAGSTDGTAAGTNGASKETLLTPFLDVLTNFRQEVRLAAIAGDTKSVLAIADKLRDDVLPELGVRMEDTGGGGGGAGDVISVWKLADPAVMRKERAQKEAARLEKERQKEEAARKAAEREERAKIPPQQMFLTDTELYSAFDTVTGLPTHDKQGEPLSKGVQKKLAKEQAKQKEAHDKYLAKLEG